MQVQGKLDKVTTELYGLLREVVSHERENKHNFVKTELAKW